MALDEQCHPVEGAGPRRGEGPVEGPAAAAALRLGAALDALAAGLRLYLYYNILYYDIL